MAIGLLIDHHGRFLLQLRDDKPGLPGAGQWGFFGGHVEDGESPAAAFLREMHEELGWRPRHFELFETTPVDRDGWHVTSHAFAAHLDVPPEALVLGEGQDLALFAADALPATVAPGVAAYIARFAGSDVHERMSRAYATIFTTGLLVNASGEFLLQHRDDKPEIRNPGKWGSFGGELEPYETPHDGFVRELREELAWQPDGIQLYEAVPYEGGGAWRLAYVFAAHVGVGLESLVLGEGQGMAFFAPDALPSETVPALQALIARFIASDAYREVRG